jgi:peptide/nickel transport system permease protein
MFIIIGDLIPVTGNFLYHMAGNPFGGGYKTVEDTLTAAKGKPIPYIGNLVAPFSYDKNHLRDRLQGHSSKYLLGTDELGRDILSRLIYGARVSIIVPFGAVMISESISAVIGIMTAYYGGWLDKLGQRLVDVFSALPTLVVLITILGIFNSGLWQLIIAIGILQGPPGSRIIRGQVLSIMASPYIEAGRVIGAGDRRIMAKYVLPNVMALIILGSTVRLGGVVLIEASLSFLGFGLPPPFPSWGQMLSIQGREYMRSAPGLAIYPGIAIGLIVFSYNLLGDALRDVLDPRLRGSR